MIVKKNNKKLLVWLSKFKPGVKFKFRDLEEKNINATFIVLEDIIEYEDGEYYMKCLRNNKEDHTIIFSEHKPELFQNSIRFI